MNTHVNSRVSNLPAVNLSDTVAAHGSFNTFHKALRAAELTNVFEGTGPYTLFVPTDEAFAKLPNGLLDNWMKPENRAELVAVLKYHVLPGRASASDVGTMSHPRMMHGQSTDIKKDGEKISIDGANLISTDIASSNGVIHAIDAVIQPPTPATRH